MSTSCSPAPSRPIRASTPTRCARIWASAASRCTRRPARRAITACRRRSSAARRAASASAWPTRSRRTKDDASGRGDILPDTYDDSGYYGISDLDRPHVLVSQMRYRFPTLDELGGAGAVGARQLGRLRHLPGAVGRAVRRSRTPTSTCRRRTGQRPAVLGPDAATPRPSGPIGIRSSRAPSGSIATPSAQPAAGTFATTQERNSLRQPGFWDINLSLRKGFNITGTAAAGFPARGVQRLQPHAPRQRRDQSDPARLRLDRGAIGNRTMQVGMQYLF